MNNEPPTLTSPLVSICIPAYKAEKYLLETLLSVQKQNYSNWELIITEDGSKDGTEAIVAEFARTVSQQVHFTRHPKNQGLPATRNTGFSQAQGELIAILDADDLWLPDHLEASIQVLRTGVDLSYSACINFDSDTGRELETRALDPDAIRGFPLSLLDGRLVIQPSTVVFRKSILGEAGGFNRGFPICNDLEFWLHNARLGRRFDATGRVTCRYRKHAAALSKNAPALAAEVAKLHTLYRDWPHLERGLRAKLSWKAHWSAARMYARKKPLKAAWLLGTGAIDTLLPRR